MKTIFVTPNFIQAENDTIICSTPFGVEIMVQDENNYKTYLIDKPLEVIHAEFFNYKLERCLEQRKAAYNKLPQFEMQFNDIINETTTWKEAIEAIKSEYPKPTPYIIPTI